MAVGPVHAGIIEPGHFRFQCHGEHVFHLEISLGYQHRGHRADAAGRPHAPDRGAGRVDRRRHRGGPRPGRGAGLEGLAGVEAPPRAAVAAGRGAGAGAARQPRRRPGRAGRRRRLPADGQLLRGAAGRLPQRPGRALRQPVRPGAGGAGRRALRPPGRRRRRGSPTGWPPPGRRWRRRPGSSSSRRRSGTGPTGPGSSSGRRPRSSGWSARRRGPPACRSTSGAATRSPRTPTARLPVVTAESGDVHARAWVRLEEARTLGAPGRRVAARPAARRGARRAARRSRRTGWWSRWSRAGAASSATP